ncbi:MAG TPA: DNA polymerase Y family protein [Thermoanaerobaculia bacterium]|jgi:protein ImuB
MIACIFVPLFPLAARLRSEPELKEDAVAILEGNGNAARVVAATRKARKAGIEAGMTLPQARAFVPGLIARGRDGECERAAQQTLLEVAESFSPRVEDAEEGVVFLDLDGHPLLAGSVNPKSKIQNPKLVLAHDILATAEKASLPARVGVAASKLASRVAAGLADSPTVVAEGEESSFLAPLPLERLAPQMEIAATLERWGLRSIGDLAKLPEGEIASRLGETGRALHATARGIDPRPLEPYLAPPSFSEGMELEWPLASLEPFLFIANAALERLVGRLESQALACTRLEAALKLDPDGHDVRAIALPAPTRDVKTLLTLVRLELEARPPGAPVAGFTFSALPDRPRRAQLSLFGPAALSPDRLATTIARLAALLGADRVGSPRAVDGHRPERFTATGYAPPPPPRTRLPARDGRGLLGVRVLRPPVPLEVIVESDPTRIDAVGAGLVPARPDAGGREGRPYKLKSPPDAAPPISGEVLIAAGPWSLEEGWWSEDPADRDYWDVELSDGGLYRIYRDRRDGAWFADGVYD